MLRKMIINIAGGTGKMGQMHAPIFRKAGHKVIISGRNTRLSLEEAAEQADLTIVSVPIESTEEMIKLVAPHSKAIMDFTGVKILPIIWMLKYSPKDCQVAGLHPLYGEVKSIKGESIVYCPTKKIGKECKAAISALRGAGARITESDPRTHDYNVALTQVLRTKLFGAYGATLAKCAAKEKMNAKRIYDNFSPNPTKILIDLIARQAHPENDFMYEHMRYYNPCIDEVEEEFERQFHQNASRYPQIIRDFLGPELLRAQKRAKRLIEKSKI